MLQSLNDDPGTEPSLDYFPYFHFIEIFLLLSDNMDEETIDMMNSATSIEDEMIHNLIAAISWIIKVKTFS